MTDDATLPDATLPDATLPDEIVPDDKDWTWVLERPCPECGFDAGRASLADVVTLVRDAVPRWQERLARPDATQRPDPATWSPLEYGAHTRDVFDVFGVRLASMLESDAPEFASWDQDATALADDYAHQDPAAVARELAVTGERVATRFAAVSDDQLDRPGLRSNGSRFTVLTLGQYFVHDVVHHLHDVGA
ncbi:DinB family protein [Luteimicrobium subarcticum]|uniref:DinB family protein n=1 Tax=Luteimicrobium subarcticum TaxID=620910 RepID=A0A2M8WS22_9MICO|nr:DinB family protein [Luteimicrobium subarcticum]PJI93729.1 DinB family protein [Luteimicrobium subarcticum]